MSGKTVVNIRVERFDYSQIPALTICLPTFLDMKKLDKLYLQNSNIEEHSELHERFNDLVQKQNWNQTEHDEQLFSNFDINFDISLRFQCAYVLRQFLNRSNSNIS